MSSPLFDVLLAGAATSVAVLVFGFPVVGTVLVTGLALYIRLCRRLSNRTT